ncbi:MAG TPA: 50S ribosomal protein L24e [Thermoplasmata archaeon]|nr:50S ribosomal protein L24e [Thermoplasmata archaeon]
MVVKRQCSFCAREIEPGTGSMFVKRDGTVFHFCTSSCRKQQLKLGRVGHRFKWTRAYELKKAAEHSASVRASAASPKSRPATAAPSKAAPAAKEPAPAAKETPAPAAPARAKATGEAKADAAKAPRPRKPKPKAKASDSADDA